MNCLFQRLSRIQDHIFLSTWEGFSLRFLGLLVCYIVLHRCTIQQANSTLWTMNRDFFFFSYIIHYFSLISKSHCISWIKEMKKHKNKAMIFILLFGKLILLCVNFIFLAVRIPLRFVAVLWLLIKSAHV